jgi:hypothetical protein
MRSTIALLVGLSNLLACTKGENSGAEEAQREAARVQQEKEKSGGVAKVIRPPVPGEAKIPCAQLLDPVALTSTLGEKEPLTMKDVTKAETGSTSSCSLVRGGKRLSEAEQKAILKKEPRLGVIAGDEVCNITAFCSTIEEPERFKQKCATRKDKADESMGNFACVQIVAQGIDDVWVFRFLDADTKCILQVRGGPSNVNTDSIRACAKAARDMIGPPQIAVDAAGKPIGAPAAKTETTGSAAGSGG